jgi:hypothetical protein
MRSLERSGTFQLGDRRVRRLGYGAMHLSGPGIFGPPKDRDAALAVLREAVAAGVNHVDTSDYYGPHITNQLIREALHPYPDDLVIVTKIGARRGNDGSVLAAGSPDDLIQAVHDNLRNLAMDVLDVVNLRDSNPRPPRPQQADADGIFTRGRPLGHRRESRLRLRMPAPTHCCPQGATEPVRMRIPSGEEKTKAPAAPERPWARGSRLSQPHWGLHVKVETRQELAKILRYALESTL